MSARIPLLLLLLVLLNGCASPCDPLAHETYAGVPDAEYNRAPLGGLSEDWVIPNRGLILSLEHDSADRRVLHINAVQGTRLVVWAMDAIGRKSQLRPYRGPRTGTRTLSWGAMARDFDLTMFGLHRPTMYQVIGIAPAPPEESPPPDRLSAVCRGLVSRQVFIVLRDGTILPEAEAWSEGLRSPPSPHTTDRRFPAERQPPGEDETTASLPSPAVTYTVSGIPGRSVVVNGTGSPAPITIHAHRHD